MYLQVVICQLVCVSGNHKEGGAVRGGKLWGEGVDGRQGGGLISSGCLLHLSGRGLWKWDWGSGWVFFVGAALCFFFFLHFS